MLVLVESWLVHLKTVLALGTSLLFFISFAGALGFSWPNLKKSSTQT